MKKARYCVVAASECGMQVWPPDLFYLSMCKLQPNNRLAYHIARDSVDCVVSIVLSFIESVVVWHTTLLPNSRSEASITYT